MPRRMTQQHANTSAEPLRVAVFTETFHPKVDGIAAVTALMLDYFARHNIESILISPRFWHNVTQHANTRVITVPARSLPAYPELYIGACTPRVWRELRAFRPHVAHVIHPVLLGISGMGMALAQRIPLVASFHMDVMRLCHYFGVGWLEPLVAWGSSAVFNTAAYTFAPSQPMLDILTGRLGVRRAGLWGRGVDAVRFHPSRRNAAMRARLLGTADPVVPLLLYVGRLSSEKRLGDLRAICDALPNVRLAFVGDGPQRAELEALFAGTGTTFIGYLYGDDLAAAYASADAFVFPSSLESFGLAVLEAMASGLPIVAAQVGAVPQMLGDVAGVRGYSFPIGDVAGLLDGVRHVVTTDADTRQAMAVAVRAYAETQSWDAMMAAVVARYQLLRR
jgi:glycosyltransferase involved in cell wall biosynthesis